MALIMHLKRYNMASCVLEEYLDTEDAYKTGGVLRSSPSMRRPQYEDHFYIPSRHWYPKLIATRMGGATGPRKDQRKSLKS